MIKPDKKQITILVSTILALCSFNVFAVKDIYEPTRVCISGDVKSNAIIRSAGDPAFFTGQGDTAKFTKCTDASQSGTFKSTIMIGAGAGSGKIARCTVQYEGSKDLETKKNNKPVQYTVINQNEGARCKVEEKGTVEDPHPLINITCIRTTSPSGPGVECD